MSMEYIREYYKVPAKRGMSVKYQGKLGLIVGADGAYLKIRLNGESEVRLYHPTWEMEYIHKPESPTEEQGTVTREGNPIHPSGAPIRCAIRGNSKSLCADCVHVADACIGLQRVTTKVTVQCVKSCEGFEDIKDYERSVNHGSTT